MRFIRGSLDFKERCLWVRLLGYGFRIRDHRILRPLFSERNGYCRVLHIGSWCLKLLGKWNPHDA